MPNNTGVQWSYLGNIAANKAKTVKFPEISWSVNEIGEQTYFCLESDHLPKIDLDETSHLPG